MRNMKGIIGVIVIILAGSSLNGQDLITIDASKTYQTIEGLGGFGSFSGGVTFSSMYVKQVVDNLGCSFFRQELGPEYVTSLDSLNNSLVNTAPGTVYQTNVNFLNTLKQKGNFKYIFTVWTPPAFLKRSNCRSQRVPAVVGGPLICGQPCKTPICVNGYNYQDTTNYLIPSHYGDFAKYLGLYAKGLKSATGVDIYAIGIQNEPMFNEPYNSALLYAPAFASCLRTVGAYFAGDGQLSGIKFFGAEHAFTYSRNYGGDYGAWGGQESSKYIQYLLDSANTRQYMHAFATHGNIDGIAIDNGSSSDWKKYADKTVPYGKKMWGTEMYMDPESWTTILNSAQGIYLALKYGQLTAWAYWVLADQLFASNLPDARTAAVKQYFRFIRPDHVQIDATETVAGVGILAFRNGSDMTIIMQNENTSAKTMTLSAAVGTTLADTFQVYRSSANESCVYLGKTTSLDFSLPAKSITTLYYKASEPAVQWAPNPPANVAVTNITETGAKLTWSKPADWTVKALPSDYPVTTNGYYVFRKETTGAYTKITLTAISNLYYSVSGLKPGYLYTYAICSRDDLYNISAYSEITFRAACYSNCPDTTALPENKLEFAVYPNPAHDLIRVEIPSVGQDGEIEICSATGEIVKAMRIASASVTIDIADIPAGLYLVRLISREGSGSQTIIKQ